MITMTTKAKARKSNRWLLLLSLRRQPPMWSVGKCLQWKHVLRRFPLQWLLINYRNFCLFSIKSVFSFRQFIVNCVWHFRLNAYWWIKKMQTDIEILLGTETLFTIWIHSWVNKNAMNKRNIVSETWFELYSGFRFYESN